MNKIAHYLQEHLVGEVTDSPQIRKYFAHDNSFLQLPPAIVAYPRTEQDIRKTVSFCWQLAQRGQIMPITPRGSGSDSSGAAIGPGIVLVFPAHMRKIFDFDPKNMVISVQPGVSFAQLNQMLSSHGLFLPPYPAADFKTIGGAIGKNSAGEKSVKYGTTADYARGLRIVLANGEVVETGPLNKRELSRKMGLTTFEGEIYRSLDKLLEENAEVINEGRKKLKAMRNCSGYDIFRVKQDGHFDLTPMIVGSQGSLAIVSEILLGIMPYNPHTTLALASLPSQKTLIEVLPQISKLHPSIFDFLNRQTVEAVNEINPSQLSGVVEDLKADIHLLVEFDDFKEADQKKHIKSLKKIVEKAGGQSEIYVDENSQAIARKVRDCTATILNFSRGLSKAVPVAEDICVPLDGIGEFLAKAEKLYKAVGLEPAAWGNIGDGAIRFQPLLDLANLGDRQKLFRIADTLYATAVDMHGSISGSSGDGRVRAPYLQLQYGHKLVNIMNSVKQIFDPYGILNPGVKTASLEDVKSLMRSDYDTDRHLEYLPRS